MIANPNKFQAIILNKCKKEIVQKLKIYYDEIKEFNSVNRLSIKF